MPGSADYPLASWKDLRELTRTTLGYLVTALSPRRWDPWLVAWHSWLFVRFRRKKLQRLAAVMEEALGPAASGRDLFQAARDHYRMRAETGWGRIRELHRRGWEPRIEVDGLEHVRHGLAAGRGVVLWGMLFCGFTLPKAALWRAGFRVSHLSKENHPGISLTQLGLKVVAPLLCRAENRYLERRVIVPLDGSLSYMRDLMDLLGANGCVSIVGEHPARQNVDTEFFLGGGSFATGAPALAWKMGSALLTYGVFREGSFRYRMVIRPIEVDRGSKRQEFVEAAVQQFSGRLRDGVERHPADWLRWDDMEYRYHLKLIPSDLERLIPAPASFILVDNNQLDSGSDRGPHAIPFLEREGQYWGLPADDETAIREMERLRSGGANFLAFALPAFWWLEHYKEFARYLRRKFPCIRKDERLVVFDLRQNSHD
jgi:lauroyl/myristoyl acyltransferase